MLVWRNSFETQSGGGCWGGGDGDGGGDGSDGGGDGAGGGGAGVVGGAAVAGGAGEGAALRSPACPAAVRERGVFAVARGSGREVARLRGGGGCGGGEGCWVKGVGVGASRLERRRSLRPDHRHPSSPLWHCRYCKLLAIASWVQSLTSRWRVSMRGVLAPAVLGVRDGAVVPRCCGAVLVCGGAVRDGVRWTWGASARGEGPPGAAALGADAARVGGERVEVSGGARRCAAVGDVGRGAATVRCRGVRWCVTRARPLRGRRAAGAAAVRRAVARRTGCGAAFSDARRGCGPRGAGVRRPGRWSGSARAYVFACGMAGRGGAWRGEHRKGRPGRYGSNGVEPAPPPTAQVRRTLGGRGRDRSPVRRWGRAVGSG